MSYLVKSSGTKEYTSASCFIAEEYLDTFSVNVLTEAASKDIVSSFIASDNLLTKVFKLYSSPVPITFGFNSVVQL